MVMGAATAVVRAIVVVAVVVEVMVVVEVVVEVVIAAAEVIVVITVAVVVEAFRFITGIGLEANRTGHYPEWHNYNSKVGIILQTPSVSTITVKDINLAHYIDSLAV
ncbi:pterin-4-alpha-carbinolamine dehydratase [Elysia marginata]|uniref:4a-hydroxytetrahydrobiopterin dehydratase n=1 Tax=Elysia marginata TaxID=1093978 RepID=A0AAV4I133_9GAST|nr:pterin-4-alpha-carbinolamine dehydratase [Elysia marginata]